MDTTSAMIHNDGLTAQNNQNIKRYLHLINSIKLKYVGSNSND